MQALLSGMPHKGGRGLHAREADLLLTVIAHVDAAMVVPFARPGGDAGGKAAAVRTIGIQRCEDRDGAILIRSGLRRLGAHFGLGASVTMIPSCG